MEPAPEFGSCGNEPSGDRPDGAFSLAHMVRSSLRRCHAAPIQNILRAANKQSSTDPDEKTIAVILTTLPKAVERTIGKPLTAGPAWLMFLPLDFGRFFAAIYSPLRKWMIFDYAYHRTPQGGMLKTGR